MTPYLDLLDNLNQSCYGYVMNFYFEGFTSPNGTYVPDVVFDELAPLLSEAELRVLLYIIRRTFGFKKNADDISLKQMTEGITTREGRVLDRGTGLSKAGNARGIRGLVEKQIVVAKRNRSVVSGDQATTYTLRYKNTVEQQSGDRGKVQKPATMVATSQIGLPQTPVSFTETGGCLPRRHGGVQQVDTQETERQQTDMQPSNIRKAMPVELNRPHEGITGSILSKRTSGFEFVETIIRRPLLNGLSAPTQSEIFDAISAYITAYAREFNDRAPIKSSTTRAVNLLYRSGLPLPAFLSRMYEARAVTRESADTIRQQAGGHKTKMAYFFACLEDRLHLRTDVQKSNRKLSRRQSRTDAYRTISVG